jgi:integrase
MRVRYQGGHLRCVKRKKGPPQWEFLWREIDLFGKGVRRNAVIAWCFWTSLHLRRGELFALKWSDVDFWNLTLDIKRSIFQGIVGNCKTEASRKPVSLSLDVAADLWLWKETTTHTRADDWIFTSARVKGKHPRRPDTVMAKIIRPAAVRAGIKRRIGWHTFRHTYSTMLIANGENVKVVQELMRHANSRCLLDVYTQARISAKREAQQRIVEMILPDEGLLSRIKLQRNGPDEQLGAVG